MPPAPTVFLSSDHLNPDQEVSLPKCRLPLALRWGMENILGEIIKRMYLKKKTRGPTTLENLGLWVVASEHQTRRPPDQAKCVALLEAFYWSSGNPDLQAAALEVKSASQTYR